MVIVMLCVVTEQGDSTASGIVEWACRSCGATIKTWCSNQSDQ